MSPKEKIAKLESLLARVKERVEAPRRTGAAPFPSPAAEAQAAAPAAPEPSAPKTVQDLPPIAMPSAPPAELSSGWSEPPAMMEAVPETSADPVVEMGDDMEVEVSAEVVEVDIDIDEPGEGLMPAESGAQPVADAVANNAAEPEADLQELAPDASAPPPAAELEAEPEQPIVPANEVVEPAPSSSPRPIATEQPETYEEESAPRHTPPPESGKQVAAPSVKPEPAPRKPSVPPPSLEGHTLIGGWREPGMALPRDPSDIARGPAVRVPPPPPPPPPPADTFAPQARAASVAPRTGEASGFGPVATKPELPESAQVATFDGAAPELAPATFGELLDATLAL